MTALTLSRDYIEPLKLIKITTNGQSYYYNFGLGDISWNSQTWLCNDTTQGLIMDLGSYSEGAEVIPNTTLVLSYTAVLNANLKQGGIVDVYTAERNPQTAVLQVDASYMRWEIQSFEHNLGEEFNITLANPLSRLLEKNDGWTYSSNSQTALVTTTDYAFDKMSGVTSGGQLVGVIDSGQTGNLSGYNFGNLISVRTGNF